MTEICPYCRVKDLSGVGMNDVNKESHLNACKQKQLQKKKLPPSPSASKMKQLKINFPPAAPASIESLLMDVVVKVEENFDDERLE